jgi:hypothetical protein
LYLVGRVGVGCCLVPSKFQLFHSLSITSILGHMHGAVNVCKKITNCTF